jgi:hypothetical protein
MQDWGSYTVGSFTPYARKAFADVAAQASPVYAPVATPAGTTTTRNGRAINLAGHRYGTHRWTDPYTPPIAAYPLNYRPAATAADATTDPNKLNRLRGFTDIVPAIPTTLASMIDKSSQGQY